jgi:hypothetical protein
MALDPVTGGEELAKTIIEKIWPDKSAQEQQQIAGVLAIIQGQLDTNKAEAGSASVFVSGWRPFIGWVCGTGCAWNWIGLPLAKVGFVAAGLTLEVSPMNLSEMMPLLLGMLGLGGLRTYEKINGVAATSLSGN